MQDDWKKKFFSSKRNRVLTLGFAICIIAFSLITPFTSRRSHHDSDGVSGAARYAAIKSNFPDPCLVEDESQGKYFAFATNDAAAGINIQIASAETSDLKNWTLHIGQDALPVLGSWALQPNKIAQVWAPEVVQRPDGIWVMYYSALSASHPRKHCIGAAIGDTVTGPYTPLNTTLVCHFDLGGAIDPAYFFDPLTGSSFLYFKDDGNAIGHGGACSNLVAPVEETPLRSLQLDEHDLVTQVASAEWLLDSFPQIDGPNIEGPQMWYVEKPVPQYHLVYSSGCYGDETYKLKHIICVIKPAPYWGSSLEACSWQTAETLKMFYNDGSQEWRMRELIKTGDMLVRGRKDSSVFAPGSAGVDRKGRVMAFHADLNMNYFKSPATEQRVRGMFITKLDYAGVNAYSGKNDGVHIGELKY